MIGPTWFLLAVIILVLGIGVSNILSTFFPEEEFKKLFEGCLVPIILLSILAVVLG